MTLSQPDSPESHSNCSSFDGSDALDSQLPIGQWCSMWHSNGMLICPVSNYSSRSCANINVLFGLASISVECNAFWIILLIIIGWYPNYYMFRYSILLCVTVIDWRCVFSYLLIMIDCHIFLGLFFKLFYNVILRLCSTFVYWSLRYCLAVMGVAFICLLFLVTVCPAFCICIMYDMLLWLWSPFPSTVSWVHGPSSSQ